MFKSLQVALAATLFSATAASATEIDLSSYVNANVSGYSGGSAYPAAGTTTIGGIEFLLAGYGGGTGVVQTSGNLFTINVNQSNVGSIYLIVNSAYGSFGSTVGGLGLNGNGVFQNINFVEGTNIRDHYDFGGYNEVSSDIFATAEYSTGAHFDVYKYDLPTAFNGNLTSINFSGLGGGNPQGQPFLAAITTAPPMASGVPEPTSWAMMLGGFGLVGAGLRRRRATAIV